MSQSQASKLPHRRYCAHCKDYVSKTTFYRHRQEFPETVAADLSNKQPAQYLTEEVMDIDNREVILQEEPFSMHNEWSKYNKFYRLKVCTA